jgi:hypothetical protein
MVTKRIVVIDDEGDEREVFVPAQWEICCDCRGTGGSSAYLGAFTSDEWYDQDEGFQHDYMQGRYDRPCDGCGGSGKVLSVDLERCVSEEQKGALDYMQMEADIDAEERAILRQEARLMGEY